MSTRPGKARARDCATGNVAQSHPIYQSENMTQYKSGFEFYNRGVSSIDKLAERLPDGMQPDSCPWLNQAHYPSIEDEIMNEHEHENTSNITDASAVSFADLEDLSLLSGIDPDLVSQAAATKLRENKTGISARDAWKLMGHQKVTMANLDELLERMKSGVPEQREEASTELRTITLTPQLEQGMQKALDSAAWQLISSCTFLYNVTSNRGMGTAPEKLDPSAVDYLVKQCLTPDEYFVSRSVVGGSRDLRGNASGVERQVLSDNQYEMLFGATDAGTEGRDRDPTGDQVVSSLHIVRGFIGAGFQVSETRAEICDRVHQRDLDRWRNRQTADDNRKLRQQVEAQKAAESVKIGF